MSEYKARGIVERIASNPAAKRLIEIHAAVAGLTSSPSIHDALELALVYPASGFVAEARRGGAHTVELNLEPSEGVSLFHEAHHGPATKVVPMYVERILEGKV